MAENYHRSGNFDCINIFIACESHENGKHKIYFITNNHYHQHIFGFTAQLGNYHAAVGELLACKSEPKDTVATIVAMKTD